MKKIALITNFNITEKLTAGIQVAQKLVDHAEEIMIPVAYKERILRSQNHHKKFNYATPDEFSSVSLYTTVKERMIQNNT